MSISEAVLLHAVRQIDEIRSNTASQLAMAKSDDVVVMTLVSEVVYWHAVAEHDVYSQSPPEPLTHREWVQGVRRKTDGQCDE